MAAPASIEVFTVDELSFPLWRLRETDSTNGVAWRLLEAGYAPPLAVQAESQSAGRGQWGRVWRSEPGGLYLSLLWAPQRDLLPQAPWVLASVWGLAASLNQLGAPAGLKWPNDLLLEERKLGGIKLERKGNALVIGAGVNWSNPVPPTGAQLQPFCRSAGLSGLQTLEDLLAAALGGLIRGLTTYEKEGLAPILEGYHQYFAHRGLEIELPGGGQGFIQGVTAHGDLEVLCRSPGARVRRTFPPGSLQLGYSLGLSQR